MRTANQTNAIHSMAAECIKKYYCIHTQIYIYMIFVYILHIHIFFYLSTLNLRLFFYLFYCERLLRSFMHISYIVFSLSKEIIGF